MIKYVRITVYFLMFILTFYCLSGIDLGKVMLPGKNRAFKGQMLLWLLSLAVAYGATEFIFALM